MKHVGRRSLITVAVAAVLPVTAIVALGSDDDALATPLVPGDTGQLNAAAIPRPELVAWVVKAGSSCSDVSAPLIAAQIEAESDWNPVALGPPTPHGRAEGIAQFMPGTWPSWGQDENGNGSNSPFDPADAIMAMARYDCALARSVADVAGDPTANMLAAYNAGPAKVHKYGGVPPYIETQTYVGKIKNLLVKYSQIDPLPASTAGGALTAFAAAEIKAARSQLDLPYVWGGGGPHGPTGGGFDCSGLVLFAVYQASQGRILLPHQARVQVTLGRHVPREQIRAGDVIAFQVHHSYYDHIGIYLGDGRLLNAPRTGKPVRIEALDAYWNRLPQEVRRYG